MATVSRNIACILAPHPFREAAMKRFYCVVLPRVFYFLSLPVLDMYLVGLRIAADLRQ